MKDNGKEIRAALAVALCAVLLIGCAVTPAANGFMEHTAAAALLVSMPGSVREYITSPAAKSPPETTLKAPAQVGSEAQTQEETAAEEQFTTAESLPENLADSSPYGDPDSIPEENRGVVYTEELSMGSANLTYNGIHVKNATETHSVNIADELALPADVHVEKSGEPQVLIMHTHTTEGYQPFDNGYFDKTLNTRTQDENVNVVAVGAAIAEELNAAGIVTLHDSSVFDYPAYNGAYSRSRVMVEDYLERYPSIQVVLDIHRDAIESEDTKTKPTVEIDGKKAAQIMIINGCEEDDITDYPDWETNLRFSLRLQQSLEAMYPGLARPMLFAARFYNQDLTHGSILIEMGAEANTVNEAVYSGRLLSRALIQTFNNINNEG